MSVPLRLVVDPDTGEATEIPSGPACPECDKKDDVIAGLERDVRGWSIRYAQLRRDKDREAAEHKNYGRVRRLHDHWRTECNHPRSGFSADDFLLAEPFFRKHGAVMVCRAIAGAKFDAYTTTRKNGSVKRHDDWELIFRSRSKFEEFCNRAPRDWEPPFLAAEIDAEVAEEARK